MKKLLLTSLLGLGLLLPTTFAASKNSSTLKTEISTQKQKKKKKSKKSKKRSTTNRGCTYNGHTLYVGKRGGCYYIAGNSKEYVDRSYCSGCN
ncbi:MULTISPECIES: hypothetical protein [Chryseobacterium]|uniref:PBCV-specific basic adaptor domain-containing protein n=1 Tax=Chryseobacterium taihuense TaxID=1141221 RepID=A0A4U8WMJ7_9FLAO|nr:MULTISPECIES: hypothetical protein [Chryseobacterium]QQV02643.1 hypothetical protein I6I61_16515 [Chryseobacterium sp. FDAARGOS 1104]VFB04098.1 Uncharacterised protein [Chryseobacterium taihuense]